MAKKPRVALLIETARGYGRGLLQGIARYSRLHGHWSLYLTPGDFEQALPKMKAWGGTGIIARVETPKVAKAILDTGLPIIALDLSETQLSPDNPLSELCEAHPDHQQATYMAAEHLLERGFSQFAFVGTQHRIWSHQRKQSFVQWIAKAGFECRIFPTSQSKGIQEWGKEQAVMAQWLRDLPKPAGLMACDDDRGRQVLEACRAANVQVPDEVAVVGMDNDELLCELSDPPLSSVALNTDRGGYDVAALLVQMMSGEVRDRRQVLIEPLGVVTRQSTDVLAVKDRLVADALRFIRDHGGETIQVQDVLDRLPLSRRALEMRFKNTVGRSIHAEIQRAHLERVKQLLVNTDMPIPRVAELSGFGSPSYLGVVFRRKIGMTPAQYRTHVRGRSDRPV